MPQKAKAISEALSDKELLEQREEQVSSQRGEETEITMKSLVLNAISKGIIYEDMSNAEHVEKKESEKEVEK